MLDSDTLPERTEADDAPQSGQETAPASAGTQANPDAELLAICARLEPLQREINSLFAWGHDPGFYLPGSYIDDDDERTAAAELLWRQERDLLREMRSLHPQTIEGVRAVARCLVLREPSLLAPEAGTSGCDRSDPFGAEKILLWLVDALTGREIRASTCMSAPAQQRPAA